MSQTEDKRIASSIRLPENLFWALKEIAVRNRRSVNSELSLLIENHIAETKTAPNHTA